MTAALVLSASVWAQTVPDGSAIDSTEWIVVGVRGPDDPSVAPLIEDFRKALASELGPNGPSLVVSSQSVLSRLGTSSAAVSTLLTHITDAEGAYQQFSLDAAREKFQAGIQELANVSGEPSVWEASMTAHVLLAMVYLAAQERDAVTHARAELESILRVAPDFRASGYSGDPVFLGHFKKADDKVRHLPKGALRVAVPSHAGVQVWVDAAPKGPSEKIELPAGTYHVRVTDEREAPRLRSFTHVVTVKPGEETLLTVNLEVEGALDLVGGPAFALSSWSNLRTELPSVLGERLGSGRMAFLWLDGQKNVRLAVGDAGSGRLERAVAVASSNSGDRSKVLADLAAYATSRKLSPGLVEVAPTFADVRLTASRVVEMPAQRRLPTTAPSVQTSSLGVRIGAWSSGGAAVVMAAIGIAFAVQASKSRTELDGQFLSDGQVLVPFPSQADYARQRGEQLTAERWGVGLLVGAGLAAAASVVLFVLDARGVEPSLAGGRATAVPGGFCLTF